MTTPMKIREYMTNCLLRAIQAAGGQGLQSLCEELALLYKQATELTVPDIHARLIEIVRQEEAEKVRREGLEIDSEEEGGS